MLKSAASTPQRYVLRLYVTGSTPRSARAITNIRTLCDRHLEGRYDLEIVDIYQQPTLASGDQIIAAPTLIRRLPQPLRKVIGDLSDEEQFLVGLDLSPQQQSRENPQTVAGKP
jgi:circadian clock protein KaiB